MVTTIRHFYQYLLSETYSILSKFHTGYEKYEPNLNKLLKSQEKTKAGSFNP